MKPKTQASCRSRLRRIEGQVRGIQRMIEDSRGMVVGTFGELDQTLDAVQLRLPDLLSVTQQTLENTRDITEATKHTWPLNGYWKKKEKEEAAAAKKAAAEAKKAASP